jgi:hypothetical protein
MPEKLESQVATPVECLSDNGDRELPLQDVHFQTSSIGWSEKDPGGSHIYRVTKEMRKNGSSTKTRKRDNKLICCRNTKRMKAKEKSGWGLGVMGIF